MKATVWFRISAALMLLFAVGHTVGFLAFRPPTAEGLAVWNAMHHVRFTMGGSTYSYGDFYVGFGLFISVFQLLIAWLAWMLGSHVRQAPALGIRVAWAMVALELASTVLAFRYFSIQPALLSVLAALSFAMAAIGTSRMKQAHYAQNPA